MKGEKPVKAKTKSTKAKPHLMRVTLQIDTQRIADIMCSAIEHNSMTRAWCESITPRRHTAKLTGNWYYDHPEIYDLGVLFDVTHIDAKDDSKTTVTRCHQGHVNAALKLMAQKHARHFGDFISENDDAVTADVFLQLIVFQQVIFG